MCVQGVKQRILKGFRVIFANFFCTLCLNFLGFKLPLVAGAPSSSSFSSLNFLTIAFALAIAFNCAVVERPRLMPLYLKGWALKLAWKF